jgi:hypothetical protein
MGNLDRHQAPMQALLANVDATAVATGLVPVLCHWCAGHFPCLQRLLQPTSAQVGGYLKRSRLLPLKHMYGPGGPTQ